MAKLKRPRGPAFQLSSFWLTIFPLCDQVCCHLVPLRMSLKSNVAKIWLEPERNTSLAPIGKPDRFTRWLKTICPMVAAEPRPADLRVPAARNPPALPAFAAAARLLATPTPFSFTPASIISGLARFTGRSPLINPPIAIGESRWSTRPSRLVSTTGRASTGVMPSPAAAWVGIPTSTPS